MIQRRMKTVPLLRKAMGSAHEFALAAYPEWSWRPRAKRSDPVVDAYWKFLEKRSAWMPT
jgi:hypothetical protein